MLILIFINKIGLFLNEIKGLQLTILIGYYS